MGINKNTIYQNLWDTEKELLRRKFIAVNAFIKKEERSQVNHFTPYETKNEEQIKPKISIRKEIIRIRTEDKIK